ncbi:MAG: rRNA pseudouridine synthase [Helicobacteraceae bacterium]|jgi:23S rRNA pseudouridine2605 synthase|nr:rRNA pseudouridine synthase [Helicobacteraceae bacterium]
MPNDLIRINKAIAQRGGYSRREADRLISEGRVAIGLQKVTDLATKVGEDEELFIDGKRLDRKNERYTIIVYNKPKGELVTRFDPQGRKTIFDGLPDRFSRFIAIGRLDYASEGLLLLTDSAEIADKLMRGDLERVYNVKIDGFITNAIQKAMQEGLKLDGLEGAHPLNDEKISYLAPFAKWRIEKNRANYSRLKIALTEGKNREIRRFFAHFERKALDLKRVSFGEISLNSLPVGEWRFCSKEEYRFIRQSTASKEERQKSVRAARAKLHTKDSNDKTKRKKSL